MSSPPRSPAVGVRLKIGVSACFLHPDPNRSAFAKKTLLYLEQSMAHWIMSAGALPVLIPAPNGDTARRVDGSARHDVELADYAQWLDGVVMHGGADVWPGSYGEEPLRPEWRGDAVRDAYEIDVVRAFAAAGKPVLGICRGLQLINVAYGGTLYQDTQTQRPGALQHRDGEVYDRLFHELSLEPGSRLAGLLGGSASRTVNSVHHQAIKDLAAGFAVEARCPVDGVIEAIRHQDPQVWVAGVQWHPEFHRPDDAAQGHIVDDRPLLDDFLAAARARRDAASSPA